MKKIHVFIASIILAGILAACATEPVAPIAGLSDCTDVVGRDFRATDFGFTGVADPGLVEDFGGAGVFDIAFGDGVFDSTFTAPGFNDVGIVGGPFTATERTLELGTDPLFDRVEPEPGLQTFECEVLDEDTFTLRSVDPIGFDFGEGFEDAVFEGTFDTF